MTDTTEQGLEAIIERDMLARGWIAGDPADYDRVHAVDVPQLRAFLDATQPGLSQALGLDGGSPAARLKFLARLQGQIAERGVIDVLRRGIDHASHHIDLYAALPTPGNARAEERFAANRWAVMRQLRYSADQGRRALDMLLGVNGLPLFTLELKNSLTGQRAEDAVHQLKQRSEKTNEPLFAFGRCVAHLAVDDAEVRFCTHLKGDASWFLPFNKGRDGGAGNPVNHAGLATAYLWQDILEPRSLADILEHYAQIVERKDERTGRKKREQVFPRYHQLDVVRRLLADARANIGKSLRRLIQHSAGSGKSNSIAWLAHQLAGAGGFDSVLIVTDRRILDKQTLDTVAGFTQVRATVGHADDSADLRRLIEQGKTIIVTTLQKFPPILEDIGSKHKTKRFAVLIDEAHSSQGGKAANALNRTLGERQEAEEESIEDKLNALAAARRLAKNASYYAFTATPKNKTLQMFGENYPGDDETKYAPFHVYPMKQAIEEGFILDVLKSYTPVESYYRLVPTGGPDDPEFDAARAQKRLRRYVEGHPHAVRLKAEIMADHFKAQVLQKKRIGGQARGMVVCGSIERAIQYFHALEERLRTTNAGFRCIVAFSGEHDWNGAKVTEATLNGFPSSEIPDRIKEDPYRLLVCADKFQTGYDEPLLHSMYVDKPLAGIKAVQTLSRLNRAHPDKRDVFVLDFINDTETIREAFADYYQTTILSGETDPDKLHDLKAHLDDSGVYDREHVEEVVRLFLTGKDRSKLDPILDDCVIRYGELGEDGQVRFKGEAKAFLRTYGFLGTVLDFVNAGWERLSAFLTLLVPKLPSPVEEDLSRGILERIDMDSYRADVKATLELALPEEDAEIGPVPVSGSGRPPEPKLDRLSAIVQAFNDQFSGYQFSDADRVRRFLTEELPQRVAADEKYQLAKGQGDAANARVEHDAAVGRVMVEALGDQLEAYKLFSDNDGFHRLIVDTSFGITYDGKDATGSAQDHLG